MGAFGEVFVLNLMNAPHCAQQDTASQEHSLSLTRRKQKVSLFNNEFQTLASCVPSDVTVLEVTGLSTMSVPSHFGSTELGNSDLRVIARQDSQRNILQSKCRL